MHIARHIYYWAKRTPNKPAITCEGQTLTWAEYDVLTERVAGTFLELGCERGDRVGCLLPNSLEWCVTFGAAVKAELLLVPLNSMFGITELSHIVSDSGCRVVVSNSDLIGKILDDPGQETEGCSLFTVDGSSNPVSFEDLSPATLSADRAFDATDPVAICYTSGTTGLPKGAVHTHDSVTAMITGLMMGYGMTINETFLLAAPLAFTGGVICNLAVSLYLGSHIIIEPAFDPPRTLDILVKDKVTAFGGASIFWEKLAQLPDFEDADLTSLRHGFCGGAPVTKEMIDIFLAKGVGIRQSYGCTENCGGATVPTAEEARNNPNSCGRPMTGLLMKVCDDEGNEVPTGEAGEIYLTGPQLMQGYWNNPEKTAESFDGRWFKTGDIGVLDEHGAVTIVDRKKSMIISGGVNVYPAEVEKAISTLDGVTEVAVYGRPSQQWGEEVVAILNQSPRMTETELKDQLKIELGGYKTPKTFLFAGTPLPRLSTGKIDRQQLAEFGKALETA